MFDENTNSMIEKGSVREYDKGWTITFFTDKEIFFLGHQGVIYTVKDGRPQNLNWVYWNTKNEAEYFLKLWIYFISTDDLSDKEDGESGDEESINEEVGC